MLTQFLSEKWHQCCLLTVSAYASVNESLCIVTMQYTDTHFTCLASISTTQHCTQCGQECGVYEEEMYGERSLDTQLIIFNGRMFWPEGLCQLLTRSCKQWTNTFRSKQPAFWILSDVYCSSSDISLSINTTMSLFNAKKTCSWLVYALTAAAGEVGDSKSGSQTSLHQLCVCVSLLCDAVHMHGVTNNNNWLWINSH